MRALQLPDAAKRLRTTSRTCWRRRPIKPTPLHCLLADAAPGLAAAEHAAEGAALNPQGIRSLHRDHGIVIPAAVRVVDLAGPFRIRRLHVDQDLLSGLLCIPAQILPALFDTNVPLVLFGGPHAERLSLIHISEPTRRTP